MEAWVIFSVAAAAFQTIRFMLQKQVSVGGLTPVAATFSRFAYSAPLVSVAVASYLILTPAELPHLGWAFWGFAALGGLSQILATICVVALFAERHFAVGITFKKSEVLLTALVGYLILGEAVSWGGLAALMVGAVALVILSDPPKGGQGLARFANRASGLGLLSGVFFAFSGVAYRGAVLEVATQDLALRTGLALACVTTMQGLAMAAWLAWRDRPQLWATFRAWRPGLVMGLASLGGSFCWFAAFSLQTAAYAFAVGQVELAFSLLIGVLVFGERPSARELVGMALLLGSILGLLVLV